MHADILKTSARQGTIRTVPRGTRGPVVTLVLARLVSLLLTGSLTVAQAAATAPTPNVHTEIDALLARLQTSSCEFNRNGSWHSAAEAKAHLQFKLEYLQARNTIQSTEQFIDLAATRSSMSGQPYLVKCPNAVPVESRPWLLLQLQSIRAAGRVFTPASN